MAISKTRRAQDEEDLVKTDLPYNPRTHTWLKPRPRRSGNGIRYVRRRVAASFMIAVKKRLDYWHLGGPIFDDEGEPMGEHEAGWYIGGYKWADDRPEILATIDPADTIEDGYEGEDASPDEE